MALQDKVLDFLNKGKKKVEDVYQGFGNFLSEGVQRVKDTPASQYNFLNVMRTPNVTGIKPIDYTANRIGNYIENTYVAGAKDIPEAFRQTFTPTEGKITSKNLWGAGRLGLDVLQAIPDPTDIPFAGYNYL